MNEGSRILLVEDDPVLGRALSCALEQDRWPVDHVISLAEAFEAIHTNQQFIRFMAATGHHVTTAEKAPACIADPDASPAPPFAGLVSREQVTSTTPPPMAFCPPPLAWAATCEAEQRDFVG